MSGIPPKRQPIATIAIEKPPSNMVIDFNRKILGYKTLQVLRDTLTAQEMVSGDGVINVIDDLVKLKYLCEKVVEANKTGNTDELRQSVEILGLII